MKILFNIYKPQLIGLIFIFSLLLIATNNTFAQCGTDMSDCFNYIEYDDNPDDKILAPLNRGISLNICFYLIQQADGNTGITEKEIENSIITLNEAFINTGFQFKPIINYIKEYNYNTITNEDDLIDLSKMHSRENYICVYLVDTLLANSQFNVENDYSNIDGYIPYTDPTQRKDYIFLTKKALQTIEFPHQVAHIFGLAHTYETRMGSELADQSNCAYTGDRICDTAADGCGNCTPHKWNIMSDYGNTRCRFSNGQIRKMGLFMTKYKSYLR